MDRTPRDPLVSINMPCYRQLEYARRAVETVRAQSLADFDLTLFDDGESDEYRRYVESLGDSRVRYHRNPQRLGAMRNMFQAICAGTGRYTLAFHEDDLLATHYLAAAVGILESHPTCGFVAAELREFADEPPAAELARQADHPSFELFTSGADFVRGILRGIEPMFGSVVYRRAALAGSQPAHEALGTLVDRPFLLGILERWSGAVIREPLVWYRRHDAGDGRDLRDIRDIRHRGMHADNILRLFRTYRAALPTPMRPADRSLFYGYTGYWLFTLYDLTPPDQRPSLRRFLFRAWREGLYDRRWQGRHGIRQILRALVGTGARS